MKTHLPYFFTELWWQMNMKGSQWALPQRKNSQVPNLSLLFVLMFLFLCFVRLNSKSMLDKCISTELYA